MEMEDNHHHHHHHHHQYNLTELRHLINGGGGRPVGPTAASPAMLPTPPPQQIPSLSPPQPFEAMMMMAPLGLHSYHHAGGSVGPTSSLGSGGGGGGGGGFEGETGGVGGDGGGTARWPRQETLTLLEIRSRLDSKFKEANQKGPLWDEVSRIMSEEHGYQRSGKKCREKFENLYKYYKKTKEGKAGRQDGKHYRFFRQLEALYGETSNSIINNNNQLISSSVQDYNNLGFHNLTNANNAIPSSAHLSHLEGYNNHMNSIIGHEPHNKHCDSLSLSNNSSEFESSSSDEDKSSGKMRRNRAPGRGWKVKIKEFIDSQMRKLMEKQEAWLEKLMRTLEQKEKERGLREEEWRRQETVRLDREHKFWANERAWIEARDSALMEALKNLTGKEDHHALLNNNYKAIAVNNASSSPELGLNPNNPEDQEGSEIHENMNLNAASNQGQLGNNVWPESEIRRLIQVRTSMESRFEQGGFPEEALWEDIAAKMGCLGYDRSGLTCRDKWESIKFDFAKKSNSKKRKENENECGYGNNFHNNESSSSLYNHGAGFSNTNCDRMNDHHGASSSPSNNANVGNSSTSHHHVANHDHSCFPFLMGEGSENLWDNYGLKINKGGQN